MRVFEKGDKVNFVDENNVLVGYDMEQQCCEYADWAITSEKITAQPKVKEEFDLTDYRFDQNFFEEDSAEADDDESIYMAIFKLDNIKDGSSLFLTLYNTQNGYYSHGFNLEVGGNTIYSGKV